MFPKRAGSTDKICRPDRLSVGIDKTSKFNIFLRRHFACGAILRDQCEGDTPASFIVAGCRSGGVAVRGAAFRGGKSTASAPSADPHGRVVAAIGSGALRREAARRGDVGPAPPASMVLPGLWQVVWRAGT